MTSYQRSTVRCLFLLLLVAYGALALLISIPVNAQDLDSSKEADIKRLLQLLQVERTTKVLMTEALKPLSVRLEQLLPPEQATEVLAELSKTTTKKTTEHAVLKSIPIYDKYFTHDEIKNMIQFYETSAGRKALQLQPQMTQELQKIIPEILRELTAKYPELKEAATTQLLRAAARGQTEAVKSLIGSGVTVDSQNDFGLTSLMMAAKHGHIDTVNALLEAGADVNVKSKGRGGVNALFWAAVKGHTEVVELLKKAGAKE